jgi:hypothetical protein
MDLPSTFSLDLDAGAMVIKRVVELKQEKQKL